MRDINALYPDVKMLAEALVVKCKNKGYNIKITDCVRTKDEQNEAYVNKRSQLPYPYGYHCWGLAFDICQNDKNNPYPNPSTSEGARFWNTVIGEGRNLGLTCGGDWTGFVDRCHFELPVFGTATHLIKTYGSPSSFFNHPDFKVKTPTTPILPTSSFKRILWLQVKLNINNCRTPITGKWDKNTIAALKKFWLEKTGKNCTGKVCSVNCINMLV